MMIDFYEVIHHDYCGQKTRESGVGALVFYFSQDMRFHYAQFYDARTGEVWEGHNRLGTIRTRRQNNRRYTLKQKSYWPQTL